jgi:hypothetical protein
MRLGWHLGWGPLTLSDTIWRSRRRRPAWAATLPGWQCPHRHTREDTALACRQRELRRRQNLTA